MFRDLFTHTNCVDLLNPIEGLLLESECTVARRPRLVDLNWRSPLFFLLLTIGVTFSATAQSDQSNLQFTEGRVNDSGSLSLGVSLGTYKGRGIDLPVSLSYSSDIWKIEHLGKVQVTPPEYGCCITQSVTEAIYSKNAMSGWKSALDLPIIEFPKSTTTYDYKGKSTGSVAGCAGYRIREVYIHMPDGSTHTLRKNDQPSNTNPVGVDMYGTFYAIDGSRLRFDGNGTPDTGTIYMPDGTRYTLGHPTSHLVDRNGNTMSYNEGTRQWTDTIGRVIANPLPTTPTVGDFPYSLPGLAGVNGGLLTYTLKWRKLADVRTPDAVTGNTPALRVIASEALPNPNGLPGSSNFPVSNPAQYERLFQSSPFGNSGDGPIVPTVIVGRAQSFGQVFDPVVLSEIVLPNGTSYRFGYNVYGEIDKVVYPTNAYDLYEHTGVPPAVEAHDTTTNEEDPQPYIQALRSLKTRKQSESGSGNDIREWKYTIVKDLDGGGSATVIAPDKTRSVTINYGPGPKTETYGPGTTSFATIYPFGFRDARVGMPAVKKFYSASVDGLGGEMLRQEVFQYEQTSVNYTMQCQLGQTPVTRTYPLSRTPRLTRQTTFIFEGGGPALAQSSTFQYDLSNEFTTGIDQTQAAAYHYVVVDNQTAQTGDLTQIPIGTLAKYSETVFLNDAIYRNANILGLASVAKIRDAAGNVVSQSQMVYDEAVYSPGVGRALPTSMRTWDSTKGAVTNPGAYLVTRAKFDQWGNRVEAIDAKGYVTTTVYDTNYQAFPVQVISPVPDPTGVRGSSSAFTTRISYDYTTGLPLTTTDVNNQTTTMEYNDPLLRPTRVIAPNGHQAITEYGAGTSVATRWVKARTQIDTEKWSEAISKYDGIGRTYFTKKIDAQGNVATRTEYDLMGRVLRSSNPYKVDASDNPAEAVYWTMPEYDDLSRTKKVISPDTGDVQIAYGISITGAIGPTKTITDQAGKKRTGITDALGNMVRVIEDPAGNPLTTDYVFDTLGNLRRTIQGEQSRYFMHDSLGRVLFAKQPEQDTNGAFVATDLITGNTNWSVKYSYDDNGNILTTTDARDISITGTYDRFNRLITRDYSDSTPDVNFYYDGTGLGSVPAFSKGKTTKIASTVAESRNKSFDQMGRLLSSEQRTTAEQLTGTQAPHTFSYVYNLSGALIEETYPSGRVVRNTLNSDGELSQVQSKKNAAQGFFTYADSFAYNSSGAVTRMQLGNGHWETADYDPKRLQVTKIGLGLTSADENLFRLEFQYNSDGRTDNNGSMRLQRIIVPSTGANAAFTATQSYFYDSLNRVESAIETVSGNQTWKQTFSYDRYGNRRFDAAGTTTLGTCPQGVCNPLISTASNRLAAGQNYVYDAAGSVTRDATGQRFGYDAENHQKEFFAASNQTTTPDASYQYDGEGKRVKKMVGNEVTVFVYDASGQLAAEYSTTVAPTTQATVSYLTTDHLGSPRIITDQYGRVSSRKDFTAFGDEIVTPQRVAGPNGNGYDPPNVRQDYTGYQKDGESGLEFAQARYYNAGHGRFTSVDPLTGSATIRNPQSFNRYSYVLNSPYKFTDPLGLIPHLAFGVRPDYPCLPHGEIGELAEMNLRRGVVTGFEVKSLTGNPRGKRQLDGKKKDKRVKPRKTNTEIPTTKVVGGISASVSNGDDVVQVVPTIAISKERENDLAVKIGTQLIEGHYDAEAILNKAAVHVTSNVMKAAIKDLADSFDPTVNISGSLTGPSGGVSVNIPSPARLVEALVVSGVDTRTQLQMNRIETETRVNKTLGAAAVEYHSRDVDGAEVTTSLAASARRGIELYKRAVASTPR